MKIVRIAVAALALGCALVYAGDYVSVRYHIPKGREPLGTVVVQPYYAVPLKSGKTELIFQQPQTQTCVNSLFPHLGYSPCWYLRRHRDKRTDI
jgi:hypothetical protein